MVRVTRVRSGFTLVELLVAMGIIIALAAIALLVVPSVLDQDRTTDGATRVRQALMLSKAQAARDGLPRGIRFVVAPLDPNNPARTNPLFVTELQYVEAPSPVVPNPYLLSDPVNAPQVRLEYVLDATGQITNRICRILNLTYDQASLIVPGSIISMPELGPVYMRVTSNTPGDPKPQNTYVGASALVPPVNPAATLFSMTFTQNQLVNFPDAELGGAATTVVYGFAVYPAARPLLGESIITLPRNICVDLTPGVSQPAGSPTTDYEILFAPTGQVLVTSTNGLTQPGGAGQIFLWVRDYTKYPSMAPIATSPQLTYDLTQFRAGGEQQIVALKTRSGALGVFPVTWPTSLGTYPAGQDPYTLARQGATGQ